MDKIRDIYWKYRLNIEDLIPYDSVQVEIDLIVADIRAIDWCVFQNRDNNEVVVFSEKVKRDLNDRLEYLKAKLNEVLEIEEHP